MAAASLVRPRLCHGRGRRRAGSRCLRLRIHGLLQFTPDMEPTDCQSCLANLIQMMPKYFSGSATGRCIGMPVQLTPQAEYFLFRHSTAAAPHPSVAGGGLTRAGRQSMEANIAAAVAYSAIRSLVDYFSFYFDMLEEEKNCQERKSTSTEEN